MDWIRKKLDKRISESAHRKLSDKSTLTDFSSNHYLSDNPGNNRSGSRLLTGNNKLKEDVELYIALHHNSEHALIYSSGFLANIGLISTVADRNDLILYDSLIHASIKDGMRLSNATCFSFQHNDLPDLKKKLSRVGDYTNVFIITESIFSMDGDSPDLKGITKLAAEFKAYLIVDEAHAVGVIGSKGEGMVSFHGLENQVFARIITFGKAFGLHGGAILGSSLLRDFLINFSRSFIYTTAPDDRFFIEIKDAYDRMLNSAQIDKLWTNINLMKAYAKEIGVDIRGGDSAIFTYQHPGNDSIKNISEYLESCGFDVRPILSPTVPKGTERLRISIHAHNSTEDIKQLINLIKDYATG